MRHYTPITPFAFAGRILCCLLILQAGFLTQAQAKPQGTRPAVGTMHATGEVTLNGLRAMEDQTLFAGDIVQTGATGATAVTVLGGGMLNAEAGSQIAFRSEQYFATVTRGSVAVRWFENSTNLDIQFGNYVLYVQSATGGAVATLSVAADSSAQILCREGSVGITALQGAGGVVLNAGESATVSLTGDLRKNGAPPLQSAAARQPRAPSPVAGQRAPSPVAGSGGGIPRGYIIAGAGAAAAVGIGAGVALTRGKKAQPVSPSQP